MKESNSRLWGWSPPCCRNTYDLWCVVPSGIEPDPTAYKTVTVKPFGPGTEAPIGFEPMCAELQSAT